MDFKEVNRDWVTALRSCGLVLLGFPSLSYTWFLLGEAGLSAPDRTNVIWALESWLELWRKAALFILGFVTFGYTWVMLNKVGSIILISWRQKYLKESE